jgi:hypothetical protein
LRLNQRIERLARTRDERTARGNAVPPRGGGSLCLMRGRRSLV